MLYSHYTLRNLKFSPWKGRVSIPWLFGPLLFRRVHQFRIMENQFTVMHESESVPDLQIVPKWSVMSFNLVLLKAWICCEARIALSFPTMPLSITFSFQSNIDSCIIQFSTVSWKLPEDRWLNSKTKQKLENDGTLTTKNSFLCKSSLICYIKIKLGEV